MTTAIKSVSVSLEMIKLAEEYHLSLSEAVRIGISVMLADRGETKYINRLNVFRNVQQLSLQIEELNKQISLKHGILEQK